MRHVFKWLGIVTLLLALAALSAFVAYDYSHFQPYRAQIDELYASAAPDDHDPPEQVQVLLRTQLQGHTCNATARVLLSNFSLRGGRTIDWSTRYLLWSAMVCIHIPERERIVLLSSLLSTGPEQYGLSAAADALYHKPLGKLSSEEAAAVVALTTSSTVRDDPEDWNRRRDALLGKADAAQKADLVRVSKTDGTLSLLSKGQVFAVFPVVLGDNPRGHKERGGDRRTPEGRYLLDYKNAQSGYHRSIHISYPNAADEAHAKALGVEAGGSIMLHGQKNGFAWAESLVQHFNWTNGCVALRNEDMDAVWSAVDAGTPIEIDP